MLFFGFFFQLRSFGVGENKTEQPEVKKAQGILSATKLFECSKISY